MDDVKAIFLDMDGTLLHENNQVSLYTKEIIDQLRTNGYKVFLATGRSHDEIHFLVPEHFEVDGIISSNGTLGHTLDGVLFKHTLSQTQVLDIVQRAKADSIYYEVFPFEGNRIVLNEDRTWIETMIEGETPPNNVSESEWLSRKDALNGKINWQDAFSGDGYSKIYLFAPDYDRIADFRKQLQEDQDTLRISVSNSSRYNAETMAYGIDKGSGIKEMIEHFDIKQHETLVMGDSDNDRAMFEFGHYTVAMKNARPEVQALAKDITSFTNEEDGAAKYLAQNLLGEK